MLTAVGQKSRKIEATERKGNSLFLYAEHGTLRITPVESGIVRITYAVDTGSGQMPEKFSPGIVKVEDYSDWDYREDENGFCLDTGCIRIDIQRQTGSCAFFGSDGELIFRERAFESRNLERFEKKKLSDEEQEITKVQTADGAKDFVKNAKLVSDGFAYHTRLYVQFGEEALYGLGQHEEGFASLRGKTVYLHQGNRKIAIPFLVSTKGYGLLMNTYSPMIFNDTDEEPYFYGEADSCLEYYLIRGASEGAMDSVIAGYRRLTGKAALLPGWAFGLIQSRERYETEEEILETAEKIRKSGLGLDCMVLDWLSWGDNQWGQKTLDRKRFGHYRQMTEQLHSGNVRFMISVWPNSGEGTANHNEFKENGLMLPGCDVYNALSPEGRQMYWKQLCEELVPGGTDAWWCDSSEPFAPEWSHRERVEPAVLFAEYVKEVGTHLPAEMMNAFSFFHAMGIYEGQRATEEICEKRVCNLTRSAYIGQQRFGVICWSGDIGASWRTLKRQIPAGLNFSASGIPFWTVDIGAFFVKRGDFWYWDGEFDLADRDMGYRELFTRWYQWAAFLPVFRVHGTDCRREPWCFGQEGDMFYDAMAAANRLRYSLLPYLYSMAGMVWKEDRSILRFLAFDFPDDRTVWDIRDQYLFGDDIMVCPVTEPMYYEKGNRELQGTKKSRTVYLPEGCDWYDFYSGERFEGGQWIDAAADIGRIPLFVKSGAIIWTVEPAQSFAESGTEKKFTVYGKKDICRSMYEDSGDGYGYENGEFTVTKLEWRAAEKKLFRLTNEKRTEVEESPVTVYE